LNSFFRIAKKNRQCLAVSLRQAHLLNALQADRGLTVPNLNDDNVMVFRKSKERRDKWESQIIEQHADKIIDVFEASKQQCKVVLALSLYDFEELVEIQSQAGSCYVLSASERLNEEIEIDFKKLANSLDHYGCPNTTSTFQDR
jgi:hypothetical protein